MTARPAGKPGRRYGAVLRVAAALGLALLLSLPAFSPAAADPGPLAPAPQATKTPTKTPKATSSPQAPDEDDDQPTASPTPSPSPSWTPRPDPEGERWIQLAVVGGGSLLGAVVLFMVIGGLIRAVNRRRTRR